MPDRVVDRGIGGTGAPVLADRGIGGTGIIAVITGFASICLAGQEVALPLNAPVVIGDTQATAEALRIGQLAVVDAGGTEGNLFARRVAVLFAVSGSVDTAHADNLLVAGQRVTLTPETSGVRPNVGDWVSISGLRKPGGIIEATRVDLRGPGSTTISGPLLRQDGILRIGTLPIAPTPEVEFKVGTDVTVTGPVLFGQMQPVTVAADLLATDPAALFAPDTGRFLLEGYRATPSGNLVQDLTRAVGGVNAGHSVLRLERQGSSLRGMSGLLAPTGASREPFAAAPVPDRTLGGPVGGPGGGSQPPGVPNVGGGRLGLAPPHDDASGSAGAGTRPSGGPGDSPGGPGSGARRR